MKMKLSPMLYNPPELETAAARLDRGDRPLLPSEAAVVRSATNARQVIMAQTAPQVLLIDDDPNFLRFAEMLLEQHGYRPTSAQSADEAKQALSTRMPDIILLDQQLGSTDGIELIQPLTQQAPDVPIILVTAHSSVETAVKAIKLGAFDFLPKPLEEARLVATLTRAAEHGRLVKRVRALEDDQQTQARFEELVGTSPQMQTVYRIIENVAPTEAGVMIVGESGTGKELVARAIHRRSPRAGHSFLALNMGALPKDLIESTLFGHERGAFTGAEKTRIGACQEAAGGTLFLDEVREMPIETQPKLLRFLQERTFRRVGGSADLQADVRIISATNVDPLRDVRQNRLREDLYYRLNVVPIVLPPLRERRGDIPLLATFALREMSKRHGKAFETIDDEVLDWLSECRWPGNVRQLFHTLERLVVLNQGKILTKSMLPADIRPEEPTASETVTVGMPAEVEVSAPAASPPAAAAPEGDEPIVPLETLERQAILNAISRCGSAAKAARLLGISEATIYRRIRKYHLDVPESDGDSA